MSKPTVTVYTDGACNPNPGPGGWAALLIYPGRPPQELVGAETQTTNNRMELRAALEALRVLDRPHRVELYTDSRYLRQGIIEWLPAWKAQGWQRAKGAVQNMDLWRALDEQAARHEVVWHWTRGHAGNRLNERVDQLARSAIPRPSLPVEDEQAVHIFTAVSYLSKEKRGGWAVMVRHRDQVKTLSGSERDTSSNRLHIRSAVEGLRALTGVVPVHLYTTSDYLRNGATTWIHSWAADGWRTRDGDPVRHRDLWEALAGLAQRYAITWHVVGDENTVEEMARVKELAVQVARGTGANTP